MTVVLDSCFLFALRVKRDKYHSRALEIYKNLDASQKECVTSIFVLGETINLSIFRSKGNVKFLEDISSLFFGETNFFQIRDFIPNEIRDIAKVLKKYLTPKRLLSFTDASLIYLYRDLKAESVISFDDHFDNVATRVY